MYSHLLYSGTWFQLEYQWGIKNISSRAITIPSKVVVGKLQQARMVPDEQSFKPKQDPSGGKGGSWILDQLNLEGLNFLDKGAATISQGFAG